MPLRADGFACGRSGLLARGSPPQPAFPRSLTSVTFFGRRLPAHSCATAPVSHRIPLVPAGSLIHLPTTRGGRPAREAGSPGGGTRTGKDGSVNSK